MSQGAVAAVLGGLAVRADVSAAAERRPNVIVIVSDDMGFADIGVHGCKDIPTPHIDSLAKNGIRCTNGYVSGPYCSPTRAGLLTGRYQQRYGHEFNPGPANDQNLDKGLSLDETTLPQRLREAGYATGMVGKWHLGHAEQFHPQRRGFESFFGFLGGAHSYFDWGTNDPILRGTAPAEGNEYLTDALGREAAAFIRKNGERPFFLYLTFNAVHTPMHAAPKYLSRFGNITDENRAKYAAMQSAMDDVIGGVLEALRGAGVEDNTLIFFHSDNGGPEGVNSSDNGPLRGVKATTWEGGIHIPFLVQWKAKLPQGRVYERPVIQLDIFPTALAAAGVAAPNPKPLDGVNLLPYLTGERTAAPHEALYWRFGDQIAIRMGDWKLVKGRGEGQQPLANRRNRGEANTQGALLFNLKDDLGEQHDRAAAQPAKLKELSAAWEKWDAELAEPTWGPPLRAARAAN